MSGSDILKPMVHFDLGQLLITRGALAKFKEMGLSALSFVERHQRNDWGDMDEDDKALNDVAVREGDGRIFSSYYLDAEKKAKVWIITEADRNSTTILLPSEY